MGEGGDVLVVEVAGDVRVDLGGLAGRAKDGEGEDGKEGKVRWKGRSDEQGRSGGRTSMGRDWKAMVVAGGRALSNWRC